MAYTFNRIEKTVSVMVIIGIAMLVLTAILLVRKKGWLEKQSVYYTVLNDSSALKEGMEIKFKGFSIGTVKDFDLNEDDYIRVDVVIKKKYEDKVRKGSVLKLNSPVLGLGSASFELKVGRGRGYVMPGEMVYSSDSEIGRYLLANMDLPKNFYTENAKAIVTSIRGMTEDMQRSFRPVGKIVLNLKQTTDKVNLMIDNLNKSDNSFNRFMSDRGRMFRRIDGMMGNLKKTTRRIDNFMIKLNNIAAAIEKNPLIGAKPSEEKKKK